MSIVRVRGLFCIKKLDAQTALTQLENQVVLAKIIDIKVVESDEGAKTCTATKTISIKLSVFDRVFLVLSAVRELPQL